MGKNICFQEIVVLAIGFQLQLPEKFNWHWLCLKLSDKKIDTGNDNIHVFYLFPFVIKLKLFFLCLHMIFQ